MCGIVKTYKQPVGATRFIGIKYGDEDRDGGGFGGQWKEWFAAGRFDKLESLLTGEFKRSYEDSSAYIGLMRWKDGEKFEYWIGMFLPEGTEAPEGYEFVDFPASNFGVCWLRGPESEIYGKEDKCAERLSQDGYEIAADEKGAWWFFERYGCPRFTTPDENGNIILDICHFVK
ncbi:MAG TPA: AraC family transcriptional regulator [Clostridia bacterium]|nr:AraC family transcriptional regulator [Clostridia bacterium]